MVARGQAVSHAVMSGRRAMTKPRRKTPSIGPDVEGCEVHEVQIPGKKIEPQRPFLDTLVLRSIVTKAAYLEFVSMMIYSLSAVRPVKQRQRSWLLYFIRLAGLHGMTQPPKERQIER